MTLYFVFVWLTLRICDSNFLIQTNCVLLKSVQKVLKYKYYYIIFQLQMCNMYLVLPMKRDLLGCMTPTHNWATRKLLKVKKSLVFGPYKLDYLVKGVACRGFFSEYCIYIVILFFVNLMVILFIFHM